ncbi:MAG: peptidase C39 family protein, partial [Chloroflexota bacterium]|nr:peptidase C39 family protein [Chloroflexota bacterium]
VRMLGAAVSDSTNGPGSQASIPLSSEPVELPVPGLSQEIHAHQYPQWGGGGEAWCSPTSTQMVVAFWGHAPGADDLAWVDPAYADPSVDFAARSSYDAAYKGTGNWPFNAAYAGRFGLDAFVTQLRSLAEAERFIRAGIPLVASIATRPAELDGFLFAAGTNGHLVVIVGFDASGNPIVNDPAAWSNDSVRRVYDRAQFERVWLRGSSGTVYVIHPASVPLPPVASDATPNW